MSRLETIEYFNRRIREKTDWIVSSVAALRANPDLEAHYIWNNIKQSANEIITFAEKIAVMKEQKQ